jgi:hypothetical protein
MQERSCSINFLFFLKIKREKDSFRQDHGPYIYSVGAMHIRSSGQGYFIFHFIYVCNSIKSCLYTTNIYIPYIHWIGSTTYPLQTYFARFSFSLEKKRSLSLLH